MAEAKLCAVEGCDKRHFAKSFCRNHHHRWKRYGDPLGGPTSKGEPLKWLRDHVSYEGEDCLIWPYAMRGGADKETDYGLVRDEDTGKSVYAHRMMCKLAHGEPPTPEHEAAHSCGRGYDGCVHPKHLRWDTKKGNASDRALHGTENRGERNGHARLSADDVRDIRKAILSETHTAIAARYGVTRQAIGDIANGRRWGWLE